MNAFSRIWRLWSEIHEESIDRTRQSLDWRPLVVLLVVAVSLTLQEFVGDRGFFRRNLMGGVDWYDPTSYAELWSFVWWSGWRVFGYLVLPVVVVLCMPGERLRDYHWSFRGFVKHLALYAVLFALLAPALWVMSRTPDFQRIYPFYKLANRSLFDFWAWSALYAAQFLALEFFFRGFMLHGTKRALGVHAIWVMVVPYCMIHYGKTLTETMAAIGAGIILGTIAMRTKSIWGGVVIHVATGLTMDLLTVGPIGNP
jgi:membrane protease YdiL (CAAX protease family)